MRSCPRAAAARLLCGAKTRRVARFLSIKPEMQPPSLINDWRRRFCCTAQLPDRGIPPHIPAVIALFERAEVSRDIGPLLRVGHAGEWHAVPRHDLLGRHQL